MATTTTNEFIPLSVPALQGNEWNYIKQCLDTNWVSSAGAFVDQFEARIASYVSRKHAVACVNGTSALHLALMCLGIGEGDEVVAPAISFVASVNPLKYVGAYPVFIDIERNHGQMDCDKLEQFLQNECESVQQQLVNKHTRRPVKAILMVDLLGHPCDRDRISELADRYNLFILEDAAESLGAQYKGTKVGSQTSIACFSFNGNKIITSGAGGMLVTDNTKWAEYAKYLSTQAKDDPIECIHHEVGYNYRISNVQAALGLAQFEQLEHFILEKRAIAKRYVDLFADLEQVEHFSEASWARSTYWLFTVILKQSSRPLMKYLNDHRIQTRPLWFPLPDLKPFQNCYAYHCVTARELYDTALSIPSSVGLTEQNQIMIYDLIKKGLSQ